MMWMQKNKEIEKLSIALYRRKNKKRKNPRWLGSDSLPEKYV